MNWTMVNQGYNYQVTVFRFTDKGYHFSKRVIGYYKTLEDAKKACSKEIANKYVAADCDVIFSDDNYLGPYRAMFDLYFNEKWDGYGYFQIIQIMKPHL